MPLPGPAYSGTSGNYPHFSHLLKHRHADQTQASFAEVQATAQHDWAAPGRPLAPLLSRHCGSGTWGPQSSTCDVDTTSHCLVTMDLTLSHAEDLSARFSPIELGIHALSWHYPILPQEQPAPFSHGALGCCTPALQLRGGESSPFVPTPLSKEEKGKKSKCYTGVSEPHPSEALSAWHRPSLFLLHIFTRPNLWEPHVQLRQTHPFHLHSPVFVLVPHPKSEVSLRARANACE